MMCIQYPNELLPKLSFVPHIDLCKLCNDVPECVVVRRSDCPLEFYEVKGKLRLREECIPSDENIFGYSMNLLGGGFDVHEHLQYRQLREGTNEWDGETILSDDTTKDLCEKVVGYPMFFLLKDFQNVKIPYERHLDKAGLKKMLRYSNDEDISEVMRVDKQSAQKEWDEKNPQYSVKGKMKINHASTMMNYWHVTLDVYEYSNSPKPIKRNKGQWGAYIRSYVINYLKMFCKNLEGLEPCTIPTRYYLK